MTPWWAIDGNSHAIRKHLRQWERDDRRQEEIEDEMDRIFRSDQQLLEVVRDMNNDERLGDALESAARRNLEG